MFDTFETDDILRFVDGIVRAFPTSDAINLTHNLPPPYCG